MNDIGRRLQVAFAVCLVAASAGARSPASPLMVTGVAVSEMPDGFMLEYELAIDWRRLALEFGEPTTCSEEILVEPNLPKGVDAAQDVIHSDIQVGNPSAKLSVPFRAAHDGVFRIQSMISIVFGGRSWELWRVSTWVERTKTKIEIVDSERWRTWAAAYYGPNLDLPFDELDPARLR